MSIAIGMIPYANMAPYRQLGAPEGCHFVPLVPRASIDALLKNEVAAAAVPVGGLKALKGSVETVGNYGIAAKGPSMSVLFFSSVPFESMHTPRTLRITSDTASSVRLLFLLLGYTHGFDRLPRLDHQGQKTDGELLIGDRALIKNSQLSKDEETVYVTDLSQKWFDIHELPFVFARWVVRKDAPEAVKTNISQWLCEFRQKEPVLVDRAAVQSAGELGVSTNLMRKYFSVIRRSLEDEDRMGQNRFFEELELHYRDPLFPPNE